MSWSPLTSAQGLGEQGAEVASGTTFADALADGASGAITQPAIPSIRSAPGAIRNATVNMTLRAFDP